MNDLQKNVLKMLVDEYPGSVPYDFIGFCGWTTVTKEEVKSKIGYRAATQIICKLRKLYHRKAFKTVRGCGYKISDEFIEDLRKVVYQTSDELTNSK